jgi:Fe-S-cluster containining protein
MKKLSPKKESDICLSCGECCRRYWITVLPNEATKIANQLKISRKKFLNEHTLLFVKIYPKSTPGKLTYPSTFFPKKLIQKILKKNSFMPDSFFIVPQIVLKRNQKVCSFLNKDNSCKIYKSRPEPCKLFPFIAVPGYRENYPFCPLYRAEQKDYSKKSGNYFSKLQKYFKKVDKEGFEKLWKTPPKKGIVFLADSKIGEIELKEILLIQNSSYSK